MKKKNFQQKFRNLEIMSINAEMYKSHIYPIYLNQNSLVGNIHLRDKQKSESKRN